MSGYGQSGSCQECAITSFASVTVYEIFQSGSSLGFGMEAGTWSKKGSRFSLFLGTSMQWFHQASSLDKEDNSGDKTRFTTYLKGQFEVFHRFYVVAAPEFVNLTSFEGSVGVRYIVPVTKFLGLGIEPAYLVVQKQYTLSANIHFALR